MGYGFSDGDPDAIVRPVPGTLKPVPWNPGHAQVLAEPANAATGERFWYDPRGVLENTVGILHEAGLRPVVAAELEFYLIDPARAEDGAPKVARSIATGAPEAAGRVLSLAKLEEYQPIITAIEAACCAQGIPSSTVISEYESRTVRGQSRTPRRSGARRGRRALAAPRGAVRRPPVRSAGDLHVEAIRRPGGQRATCMRASSTLQDRTSSTTGARTARRCSATRRRACRRRWPRRWRSSPKSQRLSTLPS